MWKIYMKNKMDNSTSEHIAAAGTDWDTKVKWSDGLVKDLFKALSNFKTMMKLPTFQTSVRTLAFSNAFHLLSW